MSDDFLSNLPVNQRARRGLATSRLLPQDALDRQGFHRGDFWLGRTLTPRRRAFGWNEDMNLLTCAGPRAGKGVGSVVPNLLMFDGNAVVIDPKGELASLTARYRRDKLGQKVVVLDPAGVADVPDEMRGTFNPMAHLHEDNLRVVSDAHSLAMGLVVPRPDAKDPFWDDTALNFIQGLALYMSLYHWEDTRTLMTLRRLASVGDMKLYDAIHKKRQQKNLDVTYNPADAFQIMLEDMFACTAYGGVIQEAAGKVIQMSEQTKGNVLTGVQTHLDFLNEPMLWNVLESSSDPSRTFRLEDLRDPSGLTVYLCLPVDMMHTQGRWLRMLMMQITRFIERSEFDKTRDRPLLMMIDEFAQLGRVPNIVNTLNYAPGFGLRMWLIIQDLGQLKTNYPKEWSTILGGCGIKQFFGINDLETAKYVSEMLGEEEVEVPSISMAANMSETYGNTSSQTQGASQSEADGVNWSQTDGQNWSESDSINHSNTVSQNMSDTLARSASDTFGRSSSDTLGRGYSRTDGGSFSYGQSSGRGATNGQSASDGWNTGSSSGENAGKSRSYQEERTNERPQTTSESEGQSSGSSEGRSGGSSTSRSMSYNDGSSQQYGKSVSDARSVNTSRTSGLSHSATQGHSASRTQGSSTSATGGRSHSETFGGSQSETAGRSRTSTSGQSTSSTEGVSFSETAGRTYSFTVNRQTRKLYRPEEIMLAFTKNNLTQLTHIRDQGPFLLCRTPYYADFFLRRELDFNKDDA